MEAQIDAFSSGPLWWLTKDGDRSMLALYERHYSAYQYRDGRERRLFVGPGEKIVLMAALWPYERRAAHL